MAVSFDAAASAVNDGVSSLSFAHTVSGSNRALLVMWAIQDPSFSNTTLSNIEDITYGGVSLLDSAVFVASQGPDSNGNYYGEGYVYLVAPPTGSHNVVLSLINSVVSVCAVSYSFAGASQTNPIDGVSSHLGSGSSLVNTISSYASEIAADMVFTITLTGATSLSTTQIGQTLRTATDFVHSLAASGSTKVGALSVTTGWSRNTSSGEFYNLLIGVTAYPSNFSTITQSVTSTVSRTRMLGKKIIKAVTSGVSATRGFTATMIVTYAVISTIVRKRLIPKTLSVAASNIVTLSKILPRLIIRTITSAPSLVRFITKKLSSSVVSTIAVGRGNIPIFVTYVVSYLFIRRRSVIKNAFTAGFTGTPKVIRTIRHRSQATIVSTISRIRRVGRAVRRTVSESPHVVRSIGRTVKRLVMSIVTRTRRVALIRTYAISHTATRFNGYFRAFLVAVASTTPAPGKRRGLLALVAETTVVGVSSKLTGVIRQLADNFVQKIKR